jgi:sortase B
MKNETMFGSLKRFSKDSALAKDDPYFYIYTKDRVYKYNIFSYRTVSTSDSLYNPFSGDDAYDRYVQKALTGNQGDFPQKTDFSLRPNLMTLSTCWGTGHVYNFVVQGALTHIVMTDGTASAEEAD